MASFDCMCYYLFMTFLFIDIPWYKLDVDANCCTILIDVKMLINSSKWRITIGYRAHFDQKEYSGTS